MADGPEAGLATRRRAATRPGALARLPPAAGDPRRPAAPLDRRAEAAAAYREALELATTDAERRYLTPALAETASGSEPTLSTNAPKIQSLPAQRS